MVDSHCLPTSLTHGHFWRDMSTTLTGLQNQTFCLTEIGVSPTDAQLSSIEAIEEPELSRRLELNKQTGLEERARSITDMPDKNDGTMTEPSEIVVIQAENQPSDYAISIGADNKVPVEGSMEVEARDKGVSNVVNHTDAIGSEMAMMSASLPGDDYSASVDFRNESSLMGEYDVMLTAPQKNDGLCFSPDHKSVIDPTADGPREMNGEALHLIDDSFNEKDITITDNADRAVETIDANHETVILGNGTSVEKDETMLEEAKDGISVDLVPPCLPHESHDVLGEVANEETLVLLPDNCSVETAANVLADSLSPNATLHISDVVLESDGLIDMAVVTNNMGTSEIRHMEAEVVVEDIVAEKVTNDEGEPLSSGPFMEEPQIAPSCPVQPHPEIENAPLNVEGPGFEDGNQQSALDMEMPVTVGSPVGDSTDFGYILDDNDTEFLNVDDEAEHVEEDDNNVPAAEENRFIDNSGWSSRTRAVARYLRSLFDNEAGRGMKNLPVDNLLAGKTRKEASRMFFETLVLKTRDYIHVEQENPFEKINIQPRVKLLKSEF